VLTVLKESKLQALTVEAFESWSLDDTANCIASSAVGQKSQWEANPAIAAAVLASQHNFADLSATLVHIAKLTCGSVLFCNMLGAYTSGPQPAFEHVMPLSMTIRAVHLYNDYSVHWGWCPDFARTHVAHLWAACSHGNVYLLAAGLPISVWINVLQMPEWKFEWPTWESSSYAC
jgi:hypothetical protein